MLRLPGAGLFEALGRWVTRAGGKHLTPRGVRVVTFGLALGLALALVALVFLVQASSTPTFCGTCHIMKPYYQSWKHSKHAAIACVDCHIAPGITSEIRKKYEALSMVAKYFTGTYGTKPWAQIEDAACLRCHERRLLEGKEVFHGVLFDHTPHLTEARRGLRLRCTSCHSQIVQGSHIAVTSSTCALCHFKGQPLDEGYGACRKCHEVPERVVGSGGVRFDHSQVARLDMDCRSCHAGVVRGQGTVPRERCLGCHNEPARLARYGETLLLHRTHVSEHKVDCINCHLEIEHGKLDHAAMPAGGPGCESCHGAGHTAQQDLYAGVGGRGVPRMPGPMFLAGVTCQGCHNPAFSVQPAATAGLPGALAARANEVSCMACHGPSYRGIYLAWKEEIEKRVGALRAQLEASTPAMGGSPPVAWGDAQHNFLLVERGKGVHNMNYAYALLEQAHEQMNAARATRGLSSLARPWVAIATGSADCLSCHVGIEKQAGPYGRRTFAHAPHLLSAKLDCAACHRPHDQRAPGEVVRFGPQGCVPCHHPGGEVDAARCQKCHGDVTQRTLKSYRGEFSHKLHLENGLECGTCHESRSGDPKPQRSACQQCHQGG